MRRLVFPMLVSALLLAAPAARGAITCTVTSPGWSTAYVPANPGTNVSQSSVTVTCQRNAGGDPTTLDYTIAVNNGSNRAGAQDRARLGATANYINYENYTDSTCASLWSSIASQRIAGSMTLSGFTPTTATTSFWGCVPASQLGKPAGTYTDSVSITLRRGNATLDTGTFPVSIFTPAVCDITTAPGTVAFTYAAFQASAALASTTFGVTCSNLLPYTMALDATVGVVSGLQYSLGLSASGSTGTGVGQTFSINGTMPAGQAGTCATAGCSGTDTRTLTITY